MNANNAGKMPEGKGARMKATMKWAAVWAMVWVGTASGATVTNAFSYDAAGRLARADYGGGTRIDYAYDAAGNLLAGTFTVCIPTTCC